MADSPPPRLVADDDTPRVPSSWRRQPDPGLPGDIQPLSLPFLGTTWYTGGPAYARARIGALAMVGVLSVGFVSLYWLALWDDHRRTGFSTSFWITLAVQIVLLVLGVLVGWAGAGPFDRLRGSSRPLIRVLGQLGTLVTMLLVHFLSPGAYLTRTLDYARPVPSAVRVARADLEAQLRRYRATHDSHGGRHRD